MNLFAKKADAERIKGLKKIVINGMRFTIKRINPILDFPPDKIPQIFTDYLPRKRIEAPSLDSASQVKNYQKDLCWIIQAGVVEPDLAPMGSKEGLTAEDLFRDPNMGVKLYHEVLNHSLNRFKGFKKLFFWIGIKSSLLTHYAVGIIPGLQTLSLKKVN